MNNKNPVLELRHVKKSFHQGGVVLDVLKDINLTLRPGEIVALVGSSGSGKSTLLQLAGLLEYSNQGEVFIQGQSCQNLKDKERTLLRRNTIGYVYQFHHLLPEFTALENIVLPQMIAGFKKREAVERAYQLLNSFSLSNRASHRPSQLSGGEQQRIAILRAFSNAPDLLIADEPTGNLDEKTSDIVFQEFMKFSKISNTATIIATHNMDLAHHMDRILILHNGFLEEYRP